jgi:hypothetical protein
MKLNFPMTPIILGLIISIGINMPILLVQQSKSTAQQVIKIRRKSPAPLSRSYPKKRYPANTHKQLPNSPSRGYPEERCISMSMGNNNCK